MPQLTLPTLDEDSLRAQGVVNEDDLEAKERDLTQRKQLGGEIQGKYTAWRTPRRVHELTWFLTAAYRRGKHSSEALLSTPNIQDLSKIDKRRKNIANKLWAKARARFAKFVKNRPMPIVVPFTSDRRDKLNARATEKAFSYLYEKAKLEQKYIDAVLWAQDTAKSYWALNWDPYKKATIRIKEPVTGTPIIKDIEGEAAGDITVETISAFEILVPDLRKTHLWDQDEIMRVRNISVDEARLRFPQFADEFTPSTGMTSPFEFERQISHIVSNEAGIMAGMSSDVQHAKDAVTLIEHYTKPNSKYADGRYVAVVDGLAVSDQSELPFGFADMENPYPFVEFVDMPSVGQFYSTTFIEQLIPLQRGYNMLRDKLEMQIKMNVHPKWIVAKQSRISKAALTNEATEIIEHNFIPGMPEPHPVTPGSIVADAWRFAALIREEFDDISQVMPVVEGKAGKSKSGFQTNLLQEASNDVHAPDARGLELAIVDAAYKFRRMMKIGYTVPRLLSIAGSAHSPEVFEFSSDNIDEHATIRVQVGSALSTLKAARIQQLSELYQQGLLGDVNDPEVKRRVLSLIDLGGIEEFQEKAQRDEDMARMENLDMMDGKPMPIPMFYEDHLVHYNTHTEELKSPANKDMNETLKRTIIAHALLHMKYINPTAAANLAMELQMPRLIGPGLIPPPPPPPGPVIPGAGGAPRPAVPGQQPGAPQPTPTAQPPQSPQPNPGLMH